MRPEQYFAGNICSSMKMYIFMFRLMFVCWDSPDNKYISRTALMLQFTAAVLVLGVGVGWCVICL